jgi:hypothetical protein
LNELAKLFRRGRCPFTARRKPRSLLQYHTFKVDELGVLLSCGHVIFKEFLKRKYNDHLMQLFVTMHLSEGNEINCVDQKLIARLCRSYVVTLFQLYTGRHYVQVVHSILHLPDAAHNFTPLAKYTAFRFQNDLSSCTRSVFNSSLLFLIVRLLGILLRSTKDSHNKAPQMIQRLNILLAV